jgi:hypothetical protein
VTASTAQQIEQHMYNPEQHENSMVSSKEKSCGSLKERFADFTATPFRFGNASQVASKIQR